MSLIQQFTIGCSKTINLGNFQNIKIEAQLVIAVPEHETQSGYEAMVERAQGELKHLLETTYKSQMKERHE